MRQTSVPLSEISSVDRTTAFRHWFTPLETGKIMSLARQKDLSPAHKFVAASEVYDQGLSTRINRKRKRPSRWWQASYSWYLGLAVVQVSLWIVFARFQFRTELHVDNSSRSKKKTGGPHPSKIANKSIGERIVETSYRTSGFEDFATIFCPPQREVLPSRFREDFVENCLKRAYKTANSRGTVFYDRWPWWFGTLLRDLGGFDKNGTYPTLVGPWHYLQFKNVGRSASGELGEAVGTAPRLQLCVYEKGGTKSWKKVQCQHNHDYEGETPEFNQCWKTQPPYDEKFFDSKGSARADGRKNASVDAYQSEKVVFLRDPLERFLSGFLDKCVLRRDAVDHCEPLLVFGESNSNSTSNNSDDKQKSPIEDMLWDKQRTFQAYVDTFPLRWNMHFFPQSFYCGGLYKTIGDYDFVGSMGEDFYTDLDRLHKKYPGLETGIENVFQLSQKLSSGKSIFRKNRKSDAKNRGVETGAASQVLDYYTPHTVRRVLQYFAIDYVSLGLPIPEWAEKMLLQSANLEFMY